jgi:hypothetical protein
VIWLDSSSTGEVVEMTLPLSSSGKIEMHIVSNSEQLDSKVVQAIVEDLTKKKASDINQNGNKITFRGGAGDNLNPLLLITSGEVDVFAERTRIILRYCIRFTHSFIFTFLLVFVGGFLLDHNLRNNPIGSLALLAAMWLVLFGVNVLIVLIRFPLLLRRSVVKALHPKRSS